MSEIHYSRADLKYCFLKLSRIIDEHVKKRTTRNTTSDIRCLIWSRSDCTKTVDKYCGHAGSIKSAVVTTTRVALIGNNY